MSGSLKEYIIRVIAAAIICVLTKNITGSSAAIGAILKTISGVFLAIVILSPLLHLDFAAVADHTDIFSIDADQVVQDGVQLSDSALRSSITQYTEAYILDKAASLKADLSVEVTLSEDDTPVPCSVVIEGRVSPYAKSKLTKLISDDLGISKENQIWR